MSAIEASEAVETVTTADDGPKTENCFGCADERNIWTRIWQGVAAASIGVNLAAMVTEGSAVAIIAGIVACLIAPVVIYLQFKLQDTDSTLRVCGQWRFLQYNEAMCCAIESIRLSSLHRLNTLLFYSQSPANGPKRVEKGSEPVKFGKQQTFNRSCPAGDTSWKVRE
jgi:hypothetical protein